MPYLAGGLGRTRVNKDLRVVSARGVTLFAAAFAVTGGTLALAGYAFDIPRLADWNGAGIAMFPNTALCAIVSGLALGLLPFDDARAKIAVRFLGAVVMLIGLATLFEHVTNINLHIDTLLFQRPWGLKASTAPMRMGPPGSAAFTLLGLSLVLSTFGLTSRRAAVWFGLVVLAMSALPLVGFLYGANELYDIARLTGIAFQTALVIAILSIGLEAANPDIGAANLLARHDAGGLLFRRIAIPAILFFIIIGRFRQMGEAAGYYDSPFGTALRSLIDIAMTLGLLWWAANGLSRAEEATRRESDARAASEDRLKSALAALREADRRKDEFLATLAHELRNPLAPVRNMVEILKRESGSSETKKNAIETIERQISQMVRLIEDLVDVNRISRGKLELERRPTDIASIIELAVETSQPVVNGSGHRLDINLPKEKVIVEADQIRLAQVFSNLLNNASKFTRAGGQIGLEVQRKNGDVHVTVTDNGVGIPPENLTSIFEMFAQSKPANADQVGGLGIGLTLARQIVELHDGSIEAASDGVGQGSRFIVRLPAAKVATAETGVPTPVEPHKPAARRILVVDDNEDSASSMALLLKFNGNDTAIAFSGPEALQKVEEFRPEAVLLDIGLPGMDGYEVCRAIRALPYGPNMKIVAVTGWGQDDDRQRTHEAGFDAHLVKPVDFTVLLETLSPNAIE